MSANLKGRETTTHELELIPFFQGFSCRHRELQVLLALLRRTFTPAELSELDRDILAELAGEVGGGEPLSAIHPLVLIQGRSGMGKSRLIAEVRSEALSSGIRVKEIFCYERQGIPFLPVLRLVKELLLESGSRDRLWRRYSSVLTRVYPELAAELGDAAEITELPGEDGKVQLFDALTGILTELSSERPLFLVIHDLHRSDPGTADFLEFLGRNVFLEEITQRRELARTGERGPEPQEDWREIGRRERRAPEYITDGLTMDGSLDLGIPSPRLMMVANYLELLPAPGGEEVSEPEQQQRLVVDRLAELREEPFVLHISLPPLSQEEVANLISRGLGGRTFSPQVVERLHRELGGNPLHILEFCRCFHEAGAFPNDGLPNDGPVEGREEVVQVPEPLLEELLAVPEGDTPSPEGTAGRLITRRLTAVDPIPLQVLRVLALLRRPARISLLESLLDVETDEIHVALEHLQSREYVHVQPVQRTPRFFIAHEDYVRWISTGLEAEERRKLHLRIGTTLAAQERAREPMGAFETYEHLRRSGAPKQSIPFGLTASRYFSAAYAVDLAANINQHLLSLVASDEDLPVRLEVLAELSRHELRRGRTVDAKGHVKRLLEEGVDLEPAKRLEALVLLSEVYQAGQEHLKGIKTLNRALKQCAAAIDERGQARIAARLARLRLERQDPKRAINLCMRELKSLDNVAEADPERILLLELLAEAHLSKGEMVAAIHHYQRVLERVEVIGEEAKLASVLNTLGRVYYDRGNYFRAARYLFRALDVIRRLQDVRALSRAYDSLGKVYRNSGDHVRALEYFNRSLRLRERIGDHEGLSPTLNSLGSLYAHTGDYLRAIRYFKRSVEISQRSRNTVGIVRAFLHLSRAYFEIGELRQVENLTKQILILSQEFNFTDLEGEGHRLQGNLLSLRGDWKRAERELNRAVELASRRGKKSGEAAATLDLGALSSEKEEYEAALKLISRGQRQAEEI
ncbi:MAG: tetratricopeptide repeat protein, partial [Planctomycetota bacterium]